MISGYWATGSVGRLTAQKDYPTLIRAFERIVTRSEARLVILGEGEDLRLSGEVLTGGALQAEERIVHLAAFDTRASKRGSRARGNHDLFVH